MKGIYHKLKYMVMVIVLYLCFFSLITNAYDYSLFIIQVRASNFITTAVVATVLIRPFRVLLSFGYHQSNANNMLRTLYIAFCLACLAYVLCLSPPILP